MPVRNRKEGETDGQENGSHERFTNTLQKVKKVCYTFSGLPENVYFIFDGNMIFVSLFNYSFIHIK